MFRWTNYFAAFTVITWADGDRFDISNTDVRSFSDYKARSDGKECFVLDVYEPNHYVLVDCMKDLRELCYMRDVSSIPTGKFDLLSSK